MLNKKTKNEIFNGGIAGCFSVFIYQPFQVMRTSMMVTYNKGKTAGMIYIIRKILNEEGYKGFYRGFTPAIIKTTIGSGLYFGFLEISKREINPYLSKNKSNFISSGIARFFQSVIINP